MKWLFTSESVTEGHPDKVCDTISDAILDEIIAKDKNAHVACETFCTTGVVTVMGEITTNAVVDIPKIVRKTVNEIGYNDPTLGFDGNTCAVLTSIDEQSADIALGVNNSLERKGNDIDEYSLNGAGDQGMMFGYACDETEELMPLSTSLANALAKRLTFVRKEGILPYLCPDGKTQVTVEYDGNEIKRIDTIVVSSQHKASVSIDKLREDILNEVINPVVKKYIDDETKIYINPTGRFVIGGPMGDTGLTGRKIIVDTYGGVARHGGGAFSGKDPTKVDRSAAYYARYIAKNIVAAGLARKAEVQVAYAIGVATPVSLYVNTYKTGKYTDEELTTAVSKVFDLRPTAIIKQLDLLRPIYKNLASYGHFGRPELNLTWERTDKANDLIEILNKF